MKIQCNVCEVAEANVLCCADEAALCWSCDEKVHAANKLASKHQRVPLTGSSSSMPKCDICQEAVGYFFCLEDRALLCRKCDIAIHTANPHVSAHQRFLLTGVKVGLEPVDPGGASSSGTSQSIQKVSEAESAPLSKRNAPISLDAQFNKVLPPQASGLGDFAHSKSAFAGGSAAGSIPQWQFDEFIGLNDFNQNYGYMDDGSSRADNGKLGESDSSSILRFEDEELDGDECLGQVPDTSWAVPQVPSPPTASGLYWPKTYQNPFDCSMFVPDISYSPSHNLQQRPPSGTSLKRRRQC
ncbi:B-box zinc finger protein 22 [Nicotiana tomentosiformis]|uniref:B-box zinc finger protein 22 n=1 Tax=Nicotiana tomentosiformis TaxID=4098 RepID=UPI00051BDF6D|nr:B-box zinc finger protein 22 [Nicotiana tomentosiformis]